MHPPCSDHNAMMHPSVLLRDNKVGSPAYEADYEFVKAYGSLNSTVRNAYDTDTAKFWLSPAGKLDRLRSQDTQLYFYISSPYKALSLLIVQHFSPY